METASRRSAVVEYFIRLRVGTVQIQCGKLFRFVKVDPDSWFEAEGMVGLVSCKSVLVVLVRWKVERWDGEGSLSFENEGLLVASGSC